LFLPSEHGLIGPQTSTCISSSGFLALEFDSFGKLIRNCFPSKHRSHNWSRWLIDGRPLTIFCFAIKLKLPKFKCPKRAFLSLFLESFRVSLCALVKESSSYNSLYYSLFQQPPKHMCSKKSHHFDAPIIICTPFEKWNLEGCRSIDRHNYGIISSQNLSSDTTLLEKGEGYSENFV